jgi:flagellar motor switch protein FliN/FliY
MASKSVVGAQDDFSLDDLSLDSSPDFADLDNEMRLDDAGSAGGGLELGDDFKFDAGADGGGLDDTLDLDLKLDDAPQDSGSADLDLKLDDGGATGDDLNLDLGGGDQGGGGDLDLSLDEKGGDLDLNLDGDSKSGELDLDLGSGSSGDDLDLELGDTSEAGLDMNAEVNLDGGGDLDLNLDGVGTADAKSDGDVELDLDNLDLAIESSELPEGDEGAAISLDEPGEPSFSLDEPGGPSLSLDEPDEPSLSLDEPGQPSLEMGAATEEMLEQADADLGLSLDEPAPIPDAFSLATEDAALDEAPDQESEEFQAVPDVNLDDVDLNLGMAAATGEMEGEADLEPAGARVPIESASPDYFSGATEGFELPPLAPPEARGDVGAAPAEPFMAVPDVRLTEAEVMELNLGDLDQGAAAPASATAERQVSRPGTAAARAIGVNDMGRGGQSPAARAPMQSAVSQDILLSIPHMLSVQVGTVSLEGRDVANLAYGSVVQLNRAAGEPVDLLLDGKAIARGEIVLINGKNLGVRIVALSK